MARMALSLGRAEAAFARAARDVAGPMVDNASEAARQRAGCKATTALLRRTADPRSTSALPLSRATYNDRDRSRHGDSEEDCASRCLGRRQDQPRPPVRVEPVRRQVPDD